MRGDGRSPSPESVVLRLRVQPRASRTEIAGWRAAAADGAPVLAVRVTAPPVEGEANRVVVSLLARALGVRASAVHVVRGERGRDKLVRIEGLDQSQVESRLGRTQEGRR